MACPEKDVGGEAAGDLGDGALEAHWKRFLVGHVDRAA